MAFPQKNPKYALRPNVRTRAEVRNTFERLTWILENIRLDIEQGRTDEIPAGGVAGTTTFSNEVHISLMPLTERITFGAQPGGLFTSTITTDTTVDADYEVIHVDASSAAVTVTLPTAVGIRGKFYIIKKIDSSANLVTIDGDGSETVDDSTTYDLLSQYDSVTVISTGSEWFIS